MRPRDTKVTGRHKKLGKHDHHTENTKGDKHDRIRYYLPRFVYENRSTHIDYKVPK